MLRRLFLSRVIPTLGVGLTLCVVSPPSYATPSGGVSPPTPELIQPSSYLEAASHSAATLRGPRPYAYPPSMDATTSTQPLTLTLPLDTPGGATTLTLPSPSRPLPSSSGDIVADMEALVRSIQDEICSALEVVEGEGAKFHEDSWVRKEGGGGRSRVLQGGRVFDKAGVNVSMVHGVLPPAAVAQMRSRPGRVAEALGSGGVSGTTSGGSGGGASPPPSLPFYACGISLVLHPHNPMAPSVHANYRLFRVKVGEDKWVWWYGGGADLSPSYVFPEDATHFHATLKAACDTLHPTAYTRFKRWADAYFALPHRGTERRGVGGVFFDDLDCASVGEVSSEGGVGSGGGGGGDPHALLPFVALAGRSFTQAYLPILLARVNSPHTDKHKEWQQLRRGRYVEFNLVHDRGTKFGLVTPGARIESILMSLPLTARWEYQHVPSPGSPEAAAEGLLKHPVDWC